MEKYSKEQIDGTRKHFRSLGLKEVDVSLGKYRFSYFVMPQEWESKLTDYVYRCTGEPKDGYVFGISDHVKEEHRKYVVAHEYIEFNEIGIDTPNRCAKALEEELKLVPDNIKPDYVKMRKDFFKNLISYCSDRPNYTKEDLEEFKGSLSKLEELVK
jgi:hypothetical protein